MNIESFIENFAAQFEDTDTAQLNADTKFRELDEWSSLMALCIISMVDEEYNITLKGSEMRKANTIGELFDIVKESK